VRVHGINVFCEVAVLRHAGQVHGVGGGAGKDPALPILHVIDVTGTGQTAPVGRLQKYIQPSCTLHRLHF
jgi:hypothetical protein